MMYQRLITSIVYSIFKAKYIIMLHKVKGPALSKRGWGAQIIKELYFKVTECPRRLCER